MEISHGIPGKTDQKQDMKTQHGPETKPENPPLKRALGPLGQVCLSQTSLLLQHLWTRVVTENVMQSQVVAYQSDKRQDAEHCNCRSDNLMRVHTHPPVGRRR